MSKFSAAPTYNLKVVIRETGLKPDTLRAWERRYGLPQPQRTEGKHRLYSQHDIELLKWLIARQQEGLSISRAVELWRSLEAEGQDPLEAVPTPRLEAAVASAAIASGGAIADMRQAWTAACTAYDEQTAERILTQAFALYPPETVCFELLQKGLSEIGEGWYRGELVVQQEHFASALAIRRLDTLVASTPAPTRSGRILVACPPLEEHIFGPLLLTYLERRRGWEVLFLGANVPLARLETALASARPQLVIAAAQQLHTAASLADMAEFLRKEKTALAYGGLVFNLIPALRERIPGHFLGESLEQAPQLVDQIMAAPLPAASVGPLSPSYREALTRYREHQAPIEASVWQAVPPEAMPRDYLAIANHFLALNVLAALQLGDIDFVGADIEWLRGLLVNYQVEADMLGRYLAVYREAVQLQLGESGAPIIDWLAKIAGG